MGPVEYLVYTLLFLVLIGLIGIIGYYIYDNIQKNEEYKKELTSDLNTNFVDINKNFDSTSTNIDEINKSNGTKITLLDERLQSSSNLLSSNFADVRYNITGNSNLFSSNFADVRYNIIENSNLFATSNTVVNGNFNTFNTNLNKYFEFDDMATLAEKRKPFNNMNTKLFEYVTSGDHIPMLDLISKTTATAGLKINTDSTNPNNDLEICDKTGQKCFNISSDNDNLYIFPKGTARADAPFKIVAATAGGKAYANINGTAGSLTTAQALDAGGGGGTQQSANAGKIAASLSPSPLLNTINFTLPGPGTGGAGYIGHLSTPSLTFSSGSGGTGLAIGSFVYNSTGGITTATITNNGLNYTSVPTITIPAPPQTKPIEFTGLVSTNLTGQITTLPNITAQDNGYYKSTTAITITNNSKRAGAFASTNADRIVTSITIKNLTPASTIDTTTAPLDNGFYTTSGVRIISINGIAFRDNLEFDATVSSTAPFGTLLTITPRNNLVGANAWSGFGEASLDNLVVVLSEPETAVAATITPTITNGSITSLTLTTAGSKYYKPTISVSPIHLVNPVTATMPTLYRVL